jgi:hypothetical protein
MGFQLVGILQYRLDQRASSRWRCLGQEVTAQTGRLTKYGQAPDPLASFRFQVTPQPPTAFHPRGLGVPDGFEAIP